MKPSSHPPVITRSACAVALSMALVTTTATAAEPARDPMEPPLAPVTPGARPVANGTGARVAPTPSASTMPRHLMVIGGQRFVIERGQRLGVGDRLGGARIERIGDGVVWLRNASGLREVSFYDGVVKRVPTVRPPSASRPHVAAALPNPPEPRAP